MDLAPCNHPAMVIQTPKQSRKLSKRHTLEPQIFLQLELLSPGGKHVDPSKVGVLNDVWKTSKYGEGESSEEFVTHIRLQHCTDLRKGETEIRLEGPDNHIPEWPEDFDSAPKMEQQTTTPLRKNARANDDFTASKNIDRSPNDVLFQQNPHLGRHDHLLEPLPNELFQTNSIVTTPMPSPSRERSAGARHESSKSRRNGGLKKTLSSGSIDVNKVDDSSLLPATTRRRRRKSVGADVQASRQTDSTSSHSRRQSGHSRRSESLGVESKRVRPTVRRVHTNPASHRRPDKIDRMPDATEGSHKTTSLPKRPSSSHRRSSRSKDVGTGRATTGSKPRPAGTSHHQRKETRPSELLGSAP